MIDFAHGKILQYLVESYLISYLFGRNIILHIEIIKYFSILKAEWFPETSEASLELCLGRC